MSESVPGANDEEWAIIEKHTTAIGVLTIYTAMLDFVIGRFVNQLMQIDDPTGACVAASARDLSKKAELARRLIQLKSTNDTWRDCLVGIMDLVQSKICEKRNRYVHDDWDVVNSEMVRYDRRVKFAKKGSRESPTFIHVTAKTSSLDEIYELIDVVIECVQHITLLGIQYESHLRKGTPLEPPLPAIQLSNYKFQDSRQ